MKSQLDATNEAQAPTMEWYLFLSFNLLSIQVLVVYMSRVSECGRPSESHP